MDTVSAALLAALLLLLLAAVSLFRGRAPSAPSKSEAQKRAEIIAGYKRKMDKVLGPHREDPETLRAKKAELLREFSIEVSRNLFFGPEEVRDVIRDLAHYDVEG